MFYCAFASLYGLDILQVYTYMFATCHLYIEWNWRRSRRRGELCYYIRYRYATIVYMLYAMMRERKSAQAKERIEECTNRTKRGNMCRVCSVYRTSVVKFVRCARPPLYRCCRAATYSIVYSGSAFKPVSFIPAS